MISTAGTNRVGSVVNVNMKGGGGAFSHEDGVRLSKCWLLGLHTFTNFALKYAVKVRWMNYISTVPLTRLGNNYDILQTGKMTDSDQLVW